MCFDNMNDMNNEATRRMKSGTEPETWVYPDKGVDADAYKWEKAVGNRGFYRIGMCFYRIIGGFSRLFPHLPGFSRIIFFARPSGQAGLGSPSGRAMGKHGVRIFAGKVTDFYALLREVSRKFAQIRAVFTRFYAFLRVATIFRKLAIFEQACGRGCRCSQDMQRRSQIAMPGTGWCGGRASFQLPVYAARNHSCA